MIELIFIIFQLLIFLLIFSYPINIFNFSILNKTNSVNIYLNCSLNIIIHLNIYLFISFLLINIKYFFYLELIFCFVFLYLNRLEYLIQLKKINFANFKYFLFFILLNLVFFIIIAEKTKLEWDGLAHWIFKARVFFDGGNYFDFKNNIPFPYYPHLGTFVWGYFWKNSFLNYEYFGRLIFPLLYTISIFSISSLYLANKNYIFKIFSSIFLITISLDFYLFGGYQEYLLFFLFTILGIICYEHFQSSNRFKSSILIILILNLMIWTKQEGFFYSIILGLTLGLYNFKNKKLFLLFIFSVSFLTILNIYLKSFVIDDNMFNEKIINDSIINYLNLKLLFDDLIIIFKHIIISLFHYPIILFVTILMFLFLTKQKNIIDYFFYTIFILNMLFIITIYLQTNMNLESVLPVTIDRILLQSSGFYLVFVVRKFIKYDNFKIY